jgi:anti-sigma factor RsiW
MERVMDHDQIVELLGVYAIDAVDPDEADVIARHLETCPRCSQEVDEHREAAAGLAFAGETAPEGLWHRIQQQLDEAPPPLDMAPIVALPDPKHRVDEGRKRRGLRAAAAAIAVAAAVVIALLGFEVADLRSQVDRIDRQTALGGISGPGVVAIAMRSADGTQVAPAVLTPNGSGYVGPGNLPDLPANKTYQLWSIVDGKRISLGVLGNDPDGSAFTAHGRIDMLAITAEDAPGVSVSTQSPVVIAPVPRSA